MKRNATHRPLVVAGQLVALAGHFVLVVPVVLWRVAELLGADVDEVEALRELAADLDARRRWS